MRSEQGFGLVELLIAMVILNVGLLATVAAFTSGSFAINRADTVATAATIADSRMEVYRDFTYDWIMLKGSGVTLDSTYTSDPAYTATTPSCLNSATTNPSYPSCSWGRFTDTSQGSTLCTSSTGPLLTTPSFQYACLPIRILTGPDGHGYRVDTYIAQTGHVNGGAGDPLPSQRTYKDIVVVVRDARSLKVLAREESAFDCSTAATGSTCPTK